LFMKIRGHETIIYQPKKQRLEYNMETRTVIAIVKSKIRKWVRLNKPYHWVQNQLNSIPDREDLLKKVKKISKNAHLSLSISKMQNIWGEIFSKPDNVRSYWKRAGGKV
ncbi:MAG: hypothetical protein ACTSWL_01715, partial [Promethearchaeota archaeon]